MVSSNCLISIILPVYNGEKYISETIKSCLYQTYENWELIIVNDCSTDSTKKIVEGFTKLDSRIKIINNEQNKRLPKSLNVGHDFSKGELITWISHDNVFACDFLKIMKNNLISKASDILYSNFQLIDELGHKKEVRKLSNMDNILFGNPIQASFIYTKEVFIRLNGYKEDLFLVEDYDFWLRAVLFFKIDKVNQELYFLRKHDNSLTSSIQKEKSRLNSFYQRLILSYCNLEPNFFNNHSAELLAFLHVNKISELGKVSYEMIKNLEVFMLEMKSFSKSTSLPFQENRDFVIQSLRTYLLKQNRCSFKGILYLLFKRPRLIIHNSYDLRRLINNYLFKKKQN